MRFLISDSGYLYERVQRGSRRNSQPGNKVARLRGHISDLLKEQSPLGDAVRRWWKAYLDSVGSGRESDSLSGSSFLARAGSLERGALAGSIKP